MQNTPTGVNVYYCRWIQLHRSFSGIGLARFGCARSGDLSDGAILRPVKKSLTLIFDGNYFVHLANRKRRYDRVTVIYTSPIYSADDAIKKMVKNQEIRRRKSLLVVSSDQEILQFAQSHGTQILKSEDFERQVYQTLSEKKGVDRVHIRISPKEVQEWLGHFWAGTARNTCGGANNAQESLLRSDCARRAAAYSTGNTEPVGEKQKKRLLNCLNRHSPVLDDDAEAARINVHLSAREVEEWMALFGKRTKNENWELRIEDQKDFSCKNTSNNL